MKKIFSYCCLKCWHIWRSVNNYKVCPKCKSDKLDIQSEIKL